MAELLQEGLLLMIIGIIGVFSYLGLLIVVMKLLANVFAKEQANTLAAEENIDNKVIAAIGAAVHQYRNK